MPSRNAIKQYEGDSYYHLYNRGVEKRKIFMDDRDYGVFLSYLKVALSPELAEGTKEEALSSIEEARLRRLRLHDSLELAAYCLMPNHFHLLIYQSSPTAMTELMRSVMSGYVRYFNKRYERVGGLFQGRYKAAKIDDDSYLMHISRYIHLNPSDWESYPYSSYPYYVGDKQAPWMRNDRISELNEDGPHKYTQFLRDYDDYRKSLSLIKDQIAA